MKNSFSQILLLPHIPYITSAYITSATYTFYQREFDSTVTILSPTFQSSWPGLSYKNIIGTKFKAIDISEQMKEYGDRVFCKILPEKVYMIGKCCLDRLGEPTLLFPPPSCNDAFLAIIILPSKHPATQVQDSSVTQ